MSLLPICRETLELPESPELLTERMRQGTAERDERGLFGTWAGEIPSHPFVGAFAPGRAQLQRIPPPQQRLLDCRIRLEWKEHDGGTRLQVRQSISLWLATVALLGLGVCSFSALGEYFDSNWGGVAGWLAIYLVAYAFHLAAFRASARDNLQEIRKLLQGTHD